MRNKISSLILRVGLGCVFLIFGIGKFRGDEWADTMRSMGLFSHLPWNVDTSIILSGTVEFVTGFALILGLFVRFFSLAACFQLSAILILLSVYGIKETRDFGLLAMAIALFLSYEDFFSLGSFFHCRRKRHTNPSDRIG